MLNNLLVLGEATTNTGTLDEGMTVIMDTVAKVGTLVSTYPFNLFFAAGLICVAIGVFALARHSVR